jgi:hypothetical protein
VRLNCRKQAVSFDPGWQIDLAVEGVETKVVVVWSMTLGWHQASVADGTEVGSSLSRRGSIDLCLTRKGLGQ